MCQAPLLVLGIWSLPNKQGPALIERSWMVVMVFLLKMSAFSTFMGKTVVRFFTSVGLKKVFLVNILHTGMQIKKLRQV